MADEKKKPGLAMVIAEGKKAAEGEGEMPGEEESSESFDASASELFAAVTSGDEAAFKTALRACMASC